MALDEGDRPLDALVAEELPDGMQQQEDVREAMVEPFEEARIAHRPEPDGVFVAGAAVGRDAGGRA